MSTPALSLHTSNWSIAAALNVSAAASNTFFPSSLFFAASFPIDVVLPTPLTPITSNTFFSELKFSSLSSVPSSSISFITAFKAG